MHYTSLKILTALIILISALIGGIIPVYFRYRQQQDFLAAGTYFSRGIFLGVGLIHLFPDAIHILYPRYAKISIPIVVSIALLTFFILHWIEKNSLKLFFRRSIQRTVWLPYLLMIILSIHSIIEGTVLGIDGTLSGIMIIFIAILAHKGAAAFALGIEMQNHQIKNSMIIKTISIFSIMTPFGILCGSLLLAYLRSTSGILLEGLFNAMGTGTFLYIATFSSTCACTAPPSRTAFTIRQWFYFTLGLLLMAVVAIWL